ncbi:carboxymuconolactone decarboxylase family protein [Vulgatibacter incomptus]|uniref:Alkyl hydroperoxide reductase AhpD n=1 Tax=Vulgatibacter incomptus TaxID=1391653 RepID=A0A0K1PGB3_9BACT|nr:carboxymuconolactone decarboxylase family protein [Vulgatibacter incomptus]AKU92461.1 Alkylhydroperoxidase protein D [Vulgatibacter incomptus]
MTGIERLRDAIPDVARDIRLNLEAVLGAGSSLGPAQKWGVALACAASTRQPALIEAVLEDAKRESTPEVVDDALAAAALMAMNNVYYRFRHMVGKPSYTDKPARLRMNRLGKPATNKVDFELFCLAVSALNGCELCIQSHEKVVVDGGLTEDQVNDAIRLAATIQAAAISLELPKP